MYICLKILFPILVGRYGARSSSPTFIGRPPQLSMNAVSFNK